MASSSSPTKEKLKDLDNKLRTVEKNIKLPPECSQANRQLVQLVLDKLILSMRQSNVLFDNLFQDISYQGSYFDGLRIKEATEFDLNIVLSFLRKLKINVKVISDLKPPGFGKMQLEKSPECYNLTPELLAKVKRLVDKDNYLIPVEINNFMQSTVTTALNNARITVPGVKQVHLSASGPARTLKIHTESGQRIDLDLVPVFAFGAKDIPQGLTLPNEIKFDEKVSFKNYQNNQSNQRRRPKRRYYAPRPPSLKRDKTWFMVPKSYKKGGRQNAREPLDKDIPKLWRMHFPGIEKKIMLDKKSVKPLIKILKLLRDEQGWHDIASYYLKTVVLMEVLKNPSKDYWSDANMSQRFLDVLLKLEFYVEKQKLPYLLFPVYNLFCNIKETPLINIQNRLKKIRIDIENNPEKVLVYCGVP